MSAFVRRFSRNDAASVADEGRQIGFTLIELMIALALGALVVIGVLNVMSANRVNYRNNEALSELQENARTAFELMGRDIRQAGNSGCGTTGVRNNPALGTGWWAVWNPVLGFDGGAATTAVSFGSGVGQRVDGTDAVQLQGTEVGFALLSLVPINSTTASVTAGHPFTRNDVLMFCDFRQEVQEALFVLQNNPSGGSGLVITDTGDLAFEANGQVARYAASTWYIGNNGRAADGGRSLYRVRYVQGSAAAATSPARLVVEEVLPGVLDMQLRYRVEGTGDMLPATGGTAWEFVNAIEVVLTMASTTANIAVDDSLNADRRLQREFTTIVTLRNRVL